MRAPMRPVDGKTYRALMAFSVVIPSPRVSSLVPLLWEAAVSHLQTHA